MFGAAAVMEEDAVFAQRDDRGADAAFQQGFGGLTGIVEARDPDPGQLLRLRFRSA